MKKLLILTAVAALASLSGCRKDITDTIPAGRCHDQAKIDYLNTLSDEAIWHASTVGGVGICTGYHNGNNSTWRIDIHSKTAFRGKDMITAAINLRELINGCKCAI